MFWDPLASASMAFEPLHDPPTVSVSAPTGTIASGGPTVAVTWVYAQEQNDPQEWYRVVLKEGGTPVHDTGWLASADATHVLDLDALDLDGDTTWAVDVSVRGPEAIGTGDVARYQADDLANAFTTTFGEPDLTITDPLNGSVSQDPDSLTVAWSVTDPGHTQAAYRVRLLATETGDVLTTTGWVSSAVTTVDVPYVFADNTNITVEVQTRNDQGMRSR